jgi:hypothetical protein
MRHSWNQTREYFPIAAGKNHELKSLLPSRLLSCRWRGAIRRIPEIHCCTGGLWRER